MPLSPGDKLGPYEILSPIGAGGMGEVYRARDNKLNRDAAIKVLPPGLANDPNSLARFQREAQVLASLNHPNIAAIYGVEEQALILEFVEGAQLAGPLSVETAEPLIQQLIDAIEYAHERGVIHRDLKPANILVTPEGRLKVLDFGLAKALSMDPAPPASNPANSPTLTMGMTSAGVIMGTAAYMAPEQARGLAVDRRADIWAFGCIVCELLTGRALFGGETVTDTLAQVLTREIDFGTVPARYRPMVEACLERDPKRRLRDIGDARRIQPVAATDARRPVLWMAIAAVSLLAAIGAMVLRTPPAAPPPPIRFALERPVDLESISPDGRWLMKVEGSIGLREMIGVSWRPLSGTEGATYPFWSEDSRTIGFFSGGRLRTIDVDGRSAKDLTAVDDPLGGTWRGGARDGTIVFAAAGRLHALDLRTGQRRELPVPFGPAERPLQPVFLPEGDGFVYLLGRRGDRQLVRSNLAAAEKVVLGPTGGRVEFSRNHRTGEWHVFKMDGNQLTAAPIDPRTGTPRGEPVGVLDFLGSKIEPGKGQFAVANSGTIAWRHYSGALPIWRMCWFDRNGNVTGVIGEKRGFVSIELSPDETKIATLESEMGSSHLWLYNVKTGTRNPLARTPGTEDAPVWGPDGRSVYNLIHAGNTHQLIRQWVDGSGGREMIFEAPGPTEYLFLHDVTPDGRSAILKEGPTVYRLDLAAPGPKKLEPLFDIAGGSFQVRLSPDGRMIVATSDAKILAWPYPPNGTPAKEIAVANSQPIWPFFSEDSRSLFVATDDALYSYPVLPGIRLGERTHLFRLIHSVRINAHIAQASRDGSRILAITTDDVEEFRTQVLSDWTTLLPK